MREQGAGVGERAGLKAVRVKKKRAGRRGGCRKSRERESKTLAAIARTQAFGEKSLAGTLTRMPLKNPLHAPQRRFSGRP